MKKKEYIRPEMTVVEFKIEKGFAASGNFVNAVFGGGSDNGIEQYDTHDGWGDDSDNSFF